MHLNSRVLVVMGFVIYAQETQAYGAAAIVNISLSPPSLQLEMECCQRPLGNLRMRPVQSQNEAKAISEWGR